MALTFLTDEDETEASADGPRLRLVVCLPGWLERLIEWLVRLWIGRVN